MDRRTCTRVAVVALAVLLATASARAADAPIDSVVLISIDSLRPDHLGTYGYHARTSPTIDRLAASGVVFDRAYSTSSWTLPAHISLLTGLEDGAHGVVDDGHRLPDVVETLPATLRAAGIHTAGFYSGPFLHPTYGFGQGFETYTNCTSVVTAGANEPPEQLAYLLSYRDITNPIVLGKVRQWVKSGPPHGRHFVFIHLWDVHYDYVPPARYLVLFDPDFMGPLKPPYYGLIRPGAPARAVQHGIARYDGEIRYTDDTVARILGVLARAKMLERAAVIIAADHGEEFLEHGRQGHRWNLFETSIRIPLIIHLPDGMATPGRVANVVSLVDVYPTICELFGVRCEQRAGRSLVPFLRAGRDPARGEEALVELTVARQKISQVGLVRAHDKLVRWNDTGATKYFDASEMATEATGTDVDPNRLGDYPLAVRDGFVELDRRIAQASEAGKRVYADAPESAPELDDLTRRHLKSLGYIE